MNHSSLLLILFACMLSTVGNAAPPPTASELIRHFKMEQIPQEGPWFTLTYHSSDVLPQAALPQRYAEPRVAGSAIIGLMTKADFSALHKLQTDEIWHYYLGDPLQLLILHPDGNAEVVMLGTDVLHGQQVQHVVPRGAWMGAMPISKRNDSYTLMGNTLAPGFEYSDFEIGYRDELQQAYPDQAELIAQLTRKEFWMRLPITQQ